jgi:predicted enzyme related to lactoylglutathione lyase
MVNTHGDHIWYELMTPQNDAAEKFYGGYVGGNGGAVVNGPQEIPGGEFVINAVDPQGAMFSLIGPRA